MTLVAVISKLLLLPTETECIRRMILYIHDKDDAVQEEHPSLLNSNINSDSADNTS